MSNCYENVFSMSQVSNGLASRVLDYQSRGPRFKSAFHSFKVDYMSTRNQFYKEDLNEKKKKKKEWVCDRFEKGHSTFY